MTDLLDAASTSDLHSGMVWISGGDFLMGSDSHYPEEAPAHRVQVAGFWMDRHTVTNRDFARFVAATGYLTQAERPVDPADYPDAKPEMLAPASVVFESPQELVDMRNLYNWWRYVPGADWKHPRRPGSHLKKFSDHPVVHVAYEDVRAYADWLGKVLPSEAEWEFAARGGLEAAEYVWGDDYMPGGKPMANTWQGDFPYRNTVEDGFQYTAPVGSFLPNGYGLYDMAGNVWQWTDDWYQDHAANAAGPASDPHGGTRDASIDPRQPAAIPRKVTKGGSHLCAPNYCRRYRPGARMAQPVDTSISHLGFRLIARDPS